jgi:hypothetical protein
VNEWLERFAAVKMSQWLAEGPYVWRARRFDIWRSYARSMSHLYAIGGL